jgi:hypothetical protein
MLYVFPLFYVCIMDKRNHFYLVLLEENPFFYCLDQICMNLLLSQIQTGSFTDVGREYTNAKQFLPMSLDEQGSSDATG